MIKSVVYVIQTTTEKTWPVGTDESLNLHVERILRFDDRDPSVDNHLERWVGRIGIKIHKDLVGALNNPLFGQIVVFLRWKQTIV